MNSVGLHSLGELAGEPQRTESSKVDPDILRLPCNGCSRRMVDGVPCQATGCRDYADYLSTTPAQASHRKKAQVVNATRKPRRLTEAEAAEIKGLLLADFKVVEIADCFGIGQSTVSALKAGRSWPDVVPSE